MLRLSVEKRLIYVMIFSEPPRYVTLSKMTRSACSHLTAAVFSQQPFSEPPPERTLQQIGEICQFTGDSGGLNSPFESQHQNEKGFQNSEQIGEICQFIGDSGSIQSTVLFRATTRKKRGFSTLSTQGRSARSVVTVGASPVNSPFQSHHQKEKRVSELFKQILFTGYSGGLQCKALFRAATNRRGCHTCLKHLIYLF